jgi:pilus assembly protein CpaC
MALLAGIGVVSLAGCTDLKPKVDKDLDKAIARRKAAESVQEGIDQEKAAVGSIKKRPGGSTNLVAGDSIWMQSGKSRVLNVPYNVQRVSIGNPDLAGVVVLGPRSILINAKELPKDSQPGGGGGGSRSSRSGILSSRTFTPPPNIAETTVILWDSRNNTDSHTVFVTEFLAEQVLLEVTVAELDRVKMEARGIDFQTLGESVRGGYWLGGGAPIQGLQIEPELTNPNGEGFLGKIPFPLALSGERPTFAIQNRNADITALVTMLQTEGLATVLAQPKILALSGQNAVFQVGGEIPIRIVTSFSAEVEFKAFGTLVNFLPRISEDGDIILTVTPEVSQPDFSRAVEGIPTFIVRRASTTAKMREGESLVLGGLVQHTRTEEERGIPYLKDLPWAGALFRQTSYRDEVNELMVVVRPHLVKSLAPGTDLDLPSDRGPLERDDVKTKHEDATVTRPRLSTPAYNSQKKTP